MCRVKNFVNRGIVKVLLVNCVWAIGLGMTVGHLLASHDMHLCAIMALVLQMPLGWAAGAITLSTYQEVT